METTEQIVYRVLCKNIEDGMCIERVIDIAKDITEAICKNIVPANVIKTKARSFDFINETLEKEVQLHENIEMIYVIDGYEFKYISNGNKYISKEETPILALQRLCLKIDGLKAKRQA